MRGSTKRQVTDIHHNNSDQHIPVLLNEVLQYLDPREGEKYLDLTAGYGGHARAVLYRTVYRPGTVLVDRDVQAVKELQKQFGDTVQIIHMHFLEAAKKLQEEGRTFDLILADLGVSSPHLDMASRGFSITQSGPLDMRMDQRQELTAEHIVNNYSEAELEKLLRAYGEEPKAKKIAKEIVLSRPLRTTTDLAAIATRAWPGHSKSHPATRVFQALRIAVNEELRLLEEALPIWTELLAPGGRMAIISFHSLEDRIVKQHFREVAGDRYDAPMRLLTKKAVTGSTTEIVLNPRARSAKLRAAAKIKTK